jgi:coproporphyrinogen dehydrogenase HemZ
MPTIQLAGHRHYYPAADVLRLFFGALDLNGPELLRAGSAKPIIISRLISLPDENLVQIRTEAPGLFIESQVVSSLAQREIKRQLYKILSDLTGEVYPWGSLTGIRPTLVAAECLQNAGSEAGAREELENRWFVAPERAALAVETALAEQHVLSAIPDEAILIYVGVPFCPSRCTYCSFITQDALSKASLLGGYVEAVIAEAAGVFEALTDTAPAAAIYFGGGTPTSLPDALFSRLIRGILPLLPAKPGAEFTVEAGRPDTLSRVKLEIIRQAGATRLCINPQTFHDPTLARIGRRHSVEQARDAYRLARSLGFKYINMDLIAGLPGESPADFASSLRQALDLEPDSITLHTLALKRSARLSQERQSGSFSKPDPELAGALLMAHDRLAAAGLHPYYLYRQKDVAGGLENTGYARAGEGCLYNVGMMSDRRTVIGLGSGAMTKLVSGSRVERLANPRDIAGYIGRIGEIVAKKAAFLRLR